ncbi:MAG: alpha/beta fold hydrolase [Geminicoccaceae bacterium]
MLDDTTSLVEEIYAATIDPARCNQLMHLWERSFENLQTKDDAKAEPIAQHVETALKIFDRIGRQRQDMRSINSILAGLPVAALIVDDRFSIVGANQGAKPLIGIADHAQLDDLGLDDASSAKLQSWMAGQAATNGPTLLLPCFLGPEAEPNCIVASAIDLHGFLVKLEDDPNVRRQAFFLLLTIDFQFDDDFGTALCRAFELSSAETTVAMALAEGMRPSAIASQRDVSLNTVRTQIKAIQGKLSASTVPDIVRIVNGVAATVSASRSLVEANAVDVVTKRARSECMLDLRDGRQLAYKESGSLEGRPVLFIHNMLLGPDLPEEAITFAERQGWRLIALSRPGFGRSTPLAEASGAAILDTFIHDVEELLDCIGIDQVTVVGHLSGAVPALHIAGHLPDRVRALLMLNYAPFDYSKNLKALPTWQRAFGLTIRYAPHLLPFLAKAGAAHIDAGYEDQLLQALHGSIPADTAALACPKVRRLAVEGLRHSIEQGTTAFCAECPLVIQDWRDQARRIDIPARLLLGGQDRFVSAEQGRSFVESQQHFSLTIVEKAGMYLLYTHWPEVFRTLDGFWAS